jgi:hypothetical protein
MMIISCLEGLMKFCQHKTFTIFYSQVQLITVSPLHLEFMYFALCSPIKTPGRHFNLNTILQINEIQ